MKNFALLLVLTIVLSFSLTFATEEPIKIISPAPVVSGEVSNENDISASVSGEDINSVQSGDVTDDTLENVSGENAEHDHEHEDTNTTSKSTVWGAVLAVVVVIVVVALVALFSKND
ncbi:MAG: hypothetical protein J6C46_06115 [Clostridia bacterium]|nr:hypothetical protein [Clostridia bacterium]